jgi:catechol 2,3-dioxygenase-like lactoylglutathione lyase family enzyme
LVSEVFNEVTRSPRLASPITVRSGSIPVQPLERTLVNVLSKVNVLPGWAFPSKENLGPEGDIRMNVKSLVWVGIATQKVEPMAAFFKDTLGLQLEAGAGGEEIMIFRLPNGDTVELFDPSDDQHSFFTTGPVIGFLVDDVAAAKEELEAAGIEFMHPEIRGSEGFSWAHFRGPDGNIYEVTSGPYDQWQSNA